VNKLCVVGGAAANTKNQWRINCE